MVLKLEKNLVIFITKYYIIFSTKMVKNLVTFIIKLSKNLITFITKYYSFNEGYNYC